MPSKSKAKGNRFERAHLGWLIKRGYWWYKRAWGSDGRSAGWSKCVDIGPNQAEHAAVGERRVRMPLYLQLKARAKLPNYLQVPHGCDAVVFKQDRGLTLVLMRAEDVWPEL